MIAQFGDEITALLKYIISIAIMIVAWFCKNVLTAQKSTDEALHAHKLDFAAHKLEVAQNYHTKTDATLARNEHREELKRVHERLDSLPQEIANLMRSK
jgi:hypothetical protein